MKRVYVLTALVAVLLTAAGCIFGYSPVDYIVPAPTAETNLEFATRTVAQLKTLAVGQSRDEVMARMNLEPVEGCAGWSWEDREFYLRHNGWLRCIKTELLRSPYRTAALEIDGVSHEALFYYTGGTGPEGGITDQQLTPVLIVGDKLIGWGWEHPLMKQIGPRLSTAAAPALPGDRPAGAMSGAGDPAPK
ncbi:MAG: hypothetical protein Q7R68_04550 [Nitrospirales bacterium]|nr:hypothetical protein [Nitrospirales bacterium]